MSSFFQPLIWHRYLFRELVKVFTLCLFCFYFLYSIIDYSLHMQDFMQNARLQLRDLILYYTYQFIKRAPLLIPLALLVSTIKVLTTFNFRRELLALQVSGIALKQIYRPFFYLALLGVVFNFIGLEFLVPQSLNYLDTFRENHFKHSVDGNRKEYIHVLTLKDGSKLAYQTFDKNKNAFFDVIWVPSPEEIWRIKYLSPERTAPTGKYVDHLKKNGDGVFEKAASYLSYRFENLRWDRKTPAQGFIPIENRSLSALTKQLSLQNQTSYERASLLTQLCYKSLLPLLSLLVVLGVAPFCVSYGRNRATYLIYAIAIFGFIAFYALIDAAAIVSENSLFSPFITIGIPFALAFLLCSWLTTKGHSHGRSKSL